MSSFNINAARHLARRGLDSNPNARIGTFAADSGEQKLDDWQMAVLLLTPIVFYLIYVAVQYTLLEVLPALVMIEQPGTLVISETSSDPEKTNDPDSPLEKASLLDEEVVVIRQEPITKSVRRTIGHITSIGGVAARWRGIGASAAYHVFHAVVMNACLFVAGLFPVFQPVASFLCHMIATVVLCRLHMTWTHVVISPPSNLAWYRRIVGGCQVFKSLALPSLRLAVAHQLVIIMPAVFFFSMGPINEGAAMCNDLALRSLVVVASALVVVVFILIPASAHLTRVEASFLPEDVDTIVPFDRTFGGRVYAESKFSTRYFATLASFDSASRGRIIKYYVKVGLMLTAIVATAIFATYFEITAFGPSRVVASLRDFVAQVQQAQEAQQGGHYKTSVVQF